MLFMLTLIAWFWVLAHHCVKLCETMYSGVKHDSGKRRSPRGIRAVFARSPRSFAPLHTVAHRFPPGEGRPGLAVKNRDTKVER